MKRHHRALAETDQRQIRLGQPILGKLAADKGVYGGSCRRCARRQCRWRESRQAPPLIARPHHAATLRRVRREEQGIGEPVLPVRRKGDHVRAARAEAMKQQDDLSGGSSGARLQAGAVDDLGQGFTFLFGIRGRLAWPQLRLERSEYSAALRCGSAPPGESVPKARWIGTPSAIYGHWRALGADTYKPPVS